MAIPPPPPDYAAFASRPPPLPARGFAIGVAVAGVAAVVLRGYVQPSFKAPINLGDGVVPTLVGLLVFPAIGGLAGGWLSWRWLARGLPVSLPRALGIVVVATMLSLLIGCLVGGVVVGVASLVVGLTSGKQEALIGTVAVFFGAIFIAPLFVVWLFGPTFAGLVLLWTLAWRHRVNRQAALRNPV